MASCRTDIRERGGWEGEGLRQEEGGEGDGEDSTWTEGEKTQQGDVTGRVLSPP